MKSTVITPELCAELKKMHSVGVPVPMIANYTGVNSRIIYQLRQADWDLEKKRIKNNEYQRNYNHRKLATRNRATIPTPEPKEQSNAEQAWQEHESSSATSETVLLSVAESLHQLLLVTQNSHTVLLEIRDAIESSNKRKSIFG